MGGGSVSSELNGPVNLCGALVPDEKSGGMSCHSAAVAQHQGPVARAEFLGEQVSPDARVYQLLKPDFDRVEAIKEEPIGVAALDSIVRSYGSESAMGNLVADLMGGFPDETPANVALTNNGGVRDNLAPGTLKYGHLFNVLPFDNRLAVLIVNGDTLFKIVEMAARATGGGLSWSGLSYVASRCQVLSVTVQGQPLERSRRYRVMTNDYLATGGSGFNELGLTADQVILKDDAPPLRDAAVQVLKSWGRDLRSGDFFNPASPRAVIQAPCTAEDLAALHPAPAP
ncbi:MAG: 5'-nucleotidase C-terminal domain-containing protein [Bdellovibrionales bacterium]|nr:5'-nucleotidase C-terminal domain-containing protein [Bdellovibrionales bacterium]